MVWGVIIIYPFLKWAGGKTRLIPEIKGFVPETINNFIEPFVGAGSVFLSIKPEKAIINDLNKDLVICYETIRDNVDELIKELSKLSSKNNKEDFIKIRNLDRDKEKFKKQTDVQRAARIIYLNKTCFNGLYRVNSKNEFNVPFGNYKNPKILDEHNLREISEYLKSVTIYCCDFEKIIGMAKPGDFVYLDPPYQPITKTSSFTSYTKDGFSDSDQIRLKNAIDKLKENNIKFLLSNSCCDFIKELYSGYNIKEIPLRRLISASGDSRNIVKEVLIY